MLKERRMIPIQINAFCDRCGYRMEFSGRELTVCPPLYPHTCINCGFTENYYKTYPSIQFIEDDAITDTTEFDDVLDGE